MVLCGHGSADPGRCCQPEQTNVAEIRRWVSHLLPECQGRDLGRSVSSGASAEGARVWVKGISRISSKWVCRNRKGIYCSEPLSAVISRADFRAGSAREGINQE